jgi:hypothetical protein
MGAITVAKPTGPQPVPEGCWAATLGDCSKKMSREHTVSRSLFATDEVMVQGFPWCANEPKRIGVASLVAKILCEKHNNALSELDSAALHGFDVFRESVRLNNVRGKMKRPPIWNIKRLTIDGPRLERWFLKTLINVSFGGQWTIGRGRHPVGSVSHELVEAAFGFRSFGHGAGLYTSARKGEQVDSMDRVNVVPLTYGQHLCAGRFNFRGFTFFLNLLPHKFEMDGEAHLLYQEVTHKCNVQDRLSHIISIKGW